VLRDQAGERRAYYNVCRHRGTRLCEAPERAALRNDPVSVSRLDLRARWSPDRRAAHARVEGFDKKAYPLHTVALAEWEGFLFVESRPTGDACGQVVRATRGAFSRYNLPLLRTVRRIEYDVKANWKLILQNYNECLHCPTIHPELSTKLPYTSGANDLIEGPFLGGYMEIKAPNESATNTGRACALPLGTLPADDQRRAFYYALFPTIDVEPASDYAVFYTVWPVAAKIAGRVRVDGPSRRAGRAGYNIQDAEEFWDRTNRPHGIEDRVVGMQAQHHRGKQRVVERAR